MRRLSIPFIFLLAVAVPAAGQGIPDPAALGGGSSAPGAPAAGGSTAVPLETPSVAPVADPVKTGPARPPGAERPASQQFDYSVNLSSDVFGAQLFTGSFAREGAARFNPDYLVAIGDRLQIRFWGAFDFDSFFTVDPQGNIFLPRVGPIRVLGVRNRELQATVENAIRRVFRANVYTYASLAAAQPVRIFVGGFVYRPGLYNGTSMDSLLYYIDQAGGIDPERGSFLNVQVKRGGELRATVSLYDFLLEGRIPLVQLADGDVIFIAARQNVTKVTGLAQNAKRFEFAEDRLPLQRLMSLADPRPEVTHVRITRNAGLVKNVEYYAVSDARNISLANGDELEFVSDRKPGTITVRVEGEHQSAREYVLPYGSRLGELMKNIQFSDRSDADNLQLFRLSVRERQKEMLQTSLRSLESSVLTARSGTSDEARLRKEEADLILQWVARAKKIEPAGQVLVSHTVERSQLLLESGDVVRIPVRDGLVLVSGEVLFPNAIVYDAALSIDDYIRRAGGYAQNADTSRILVAHRDGSFYDSAVDGSGFFGGKGPDMRTGDQILVLPKIDVKSRQILKDWTQILFQLAVTTKVILGL